jgi:UMF1 family MFS transporter
MLQKNHKSDVSEMDELPRAPSPLYPTRRALRKARWGWCLFDFANSSFTTVAITAFGAPYFVGVLAGSEGVSLGSLRVGPSLLWGWGVALSMLIVTVTSPLMGVLADQAHLRRRLLAVYVLACVLCTAALSFVPPRHPWLALGLYVVANVAYEGAYVFYNAFLPSLAEASFVGRLSGYAWGLGYVGGLLALVASKPWMPHAYDVQSTHGSGVVVTWVYVIVAVWYAAFSLPALWWLRQTKAREVGAPIGPHASWWTHARRASRQLVATLRSLRDQRDIVLFLLAYFLYTDALTTVIEFTGVFTKEVLAFTPHDNVSLFLVLNVVAAPGAVVFGVLVDRWGPKRCMGLILVIWMVVALGVSQVHTRASFWPMAVLAAVVLGATQATSRSWMASLAPEGHEGEYMGFLTLSGKASAIVGPLMYGLLADTFSSASDPGRGHRIAMAALGGLFVLAWFVRGRVRDHTRDQAHPIRVE